MTSLETIVSLAKRKGFVFPGSDIYGGLAGTWDYGPLGVLLKENIKREWWKSMRKPHIFPLDSAIISSAKVWQSSGHTDHFTDPLVECKKCKRRFRTDHIEDTKCPECGGALGESRQFNMMFKTHAGAIEDESAVAYLRPETAQGIFINFKNVVDAFHPKLAFGIAQIGKAFRNEITPRNFVFRSREFEQMELEYFCDPKDADQYFGEIRAMRMQWFLNLGIKKENLRFRDYAGDELAHYSKATTDIEYRFGLSQDGFSELEGVANRTDFDLKNHFPEYHWTGDDFIKSDAGFVPNVIEPSVGVDRAFLAFMIDAYDEDELAGDKRVVLRLHPRLAPITVAVFPLVSNKEHITEKAKEVFDVLSREFMVRWDDIGNIGKRYRRQDEIGTPWCVTIDYQTLEDGTVTVRDRDTAKQERVAISEVAALFREKLI
ncbi:MAG: glycine--tRNA ligase [Candidatus Ryanbacteria bacterium]|nr:glycine--tRNA ligase [Candidatus Ryanbacteria bacterium]